MRTLVVIIGVLVAGFVGWFYVNLPELAEPETSIDSEIEIPSNTDASPYPKLPDDADSQARVDKEEASVDSFVTRDSTDLTMHPNYRWLNARGFTNESNIHFGNTKYLREQAKLGDMHASQLLGYQMLGTPEGNRYLTDAAILGSIQALHFLSNASKLVADGRLPDSTTPEQQSDATIQALSYLFVAELRGDNFVAPNAIREIMNQYSYTQDDLSSACTRAKTSLQSLNAARMKAGHASFDNSNPPMSSAQPATSSLCKAESTQF